MVGVFPEGGFLAGSSLQGTSDVLGSDALVLCIICRFLEMFPTGVVFEAYRLDLVAGMDVAALSAAILATPRSTPRKSVAGVSVSGGSSTETRKNHLPSLRRTRSH